MPLVAAHLNYMDLEISPLIFSNIDKRSWVYQPNYVRNRSRFRGPRETQKINLQMHQMYYDLRKAKAKLDYVESNLTAYIQRLEGGVSFEDIDLRAEWEEEATPSDEYVELLGVTELGRQIELLRYRVRSLEMS